MQLLWGGKHHQVYLWENEYVVKIPHKNTYISYEQAKKSVVFFQAEFSEYLPETTVLPWNRTYPYWVVQKRVDGVLLGDFLRHEWMSQKIWQLLSSFTEKALQVLEWKNIGFDIIGTPSLPGLKGKWNGCTNIIVHPDDEHISFIDCVVPSRTIWWGYLANRLLQSFWYQRRKMLYSSLMQDLQIR
jgi:hypothetical protein